MLLSNDLYYCQQSHKESVKGKVTPSTDPKAQSGVRGIALLFLDLGTRRG
jgi:hypothetical protein